MEERTLVAALKWFSEEKGYGFLEAVNSPIPIGDIFMHAKVAKERWPFWKPPVKGARMLVRVHKRYRGWAVVELLEPEVATKETA